MSWLGGSPALDRPTKIFFLPIEAIGPAAFGWNHSRLFGCHLAGCFGIGVRLRLFVGKAKTPVAAQLYDRHICPFDVASVFTRACLTLASKLSALQSIFSSIGLPIAVCGLGEFT